MIHSGPVTPAKVHGRQLETAVCFRPLFLWNRESGSATRRTGLRSLPADRNQAASNGTKLSATGMVTIGFLLIMFARDTPFEFTRRLASGQSKNTKGDSRKSIEHAVHIVINLNHLLVEVLLALETSPIRHCNSSGTARNNDSSLSASGASPE